MLCFWLAQLYALQVAPNHSTSMTITGSSANIHSQTVTVLCPEQIGTRHSTFLYISNFIYPLQLTYWHWTNKHTLPLTYTPPHTHTDTHRERSRQPFQPQTFSGIRGGTQSVSAEGGESTDHASLTPTLCTILLIQIKPLCFQAQTVTCNFQF